MMKQRITPFAQRVLGVIEELERGEAHGPTPDAVYVHMQARCSTVKRANVYRAISGLAGQGRIVRSMAGYLRLNRTGDLRLQHSHAVDRHVARPLER